MSIVRHISGSTRLPIGASIARQTKHRKIASTVERYGLRKTHYAVHGCRALRKQDLKLNDATPKMRVDPETYIVTADGEELRCEPATELPLAQRYFLF